MRRRQARLVYRTPFALWLDAINCRDPEWLSFAGLARFDPALVVDRWRAWPRHSEHVLWWAK